VNPAGAHTVGESPLAVAERAVEGVQTAHLLVPVAASVQASGAAKGRNAQKSALSWFYIEKLVAG